MSDSEQVAFAMSFLDTIQRAKTYLGEQGRVSLRALQREFELNDEALDELVEELVDVQQIAAREGKVLSWIGAAPTEASAPEPETRATPEASSEPAPARQPAEAERRQLTVLFCDLVGSTELASRLDPEDWREIVRQYQQTCSDVIERYEGHIAQYLGDGLLVYFGYPQAHEDDAECAARAGLEIVEAVREHNPQIEAHHGLQLAVRIGIHTGPVVVGETGAGERRETLALGDTTNLAARLEGIAAPDTVVVSPETLRLVRGIFLTEDLGAQALKGIAAPVVAHRVVQPSGVRSRLDIAAGRLTPFVGREQEFGLLLDRWEQALEGQGHTVLISGDAGIGKSRLALRLREHLRDAPHSWLEVRTSPHGQSSPLQPWIELVCQGLLFSDADTAETKLRKIERALDRAGVGEDGVPLLADLIGVPLGDTYPPLQMSPELQREKTLDLLVAWLLALGDRQPVLMLHEDLHWADPSSLELLGRIMDQAPTARVLLLLTARPEFEVPWSHPKNWTPIALGPLRPRQATAMVEALSDGSIPDEAVEQILKRSDGMPLYVEELTRNLVEAGDAAATSVPESLQDSLTARLDRLSAAREVAQVASLLGKEFPYRLLAAVAPNEEAALRDGLRRLVAADLMFQRGAPPDATFTFKHTLIQDTAAASLLKSRRHELHEGIAQVLEEQFPDEVERRPEELARHFDAAQLPDAAIAHYQRAGERAAERSANEEAIGHLTRAIELLGTLPETRERNRQELGLQMAIAAPLSAARGWADPECEGAYERARVLASEIGEGPELARVLVGLAASFYTKGDPATSSELAKQALKAAERGGNAFDLLSAHTVVGVPLYFQGEFSRALHHSEQAIGLYDFKEHAPLAHTVGMDRGVLTRGYAAWCQFALGYPDRGLATSQEAVALARRVEHPLSLATALSMAAIVHWQHRERDLTLERADETIALAEEFGLPLYLGMGRAFRGWARADSQESGEAVAEIQQGLAELARIGTGFGAPALLALLAEGCWRVGRHDDALGALGLGVARAQEQGQHFFDAELHRLRAEILLDQDGAALEEAQTLLRRALEIARGQEAKRSELRAATSLARLLRDQGQRDDARALLAPVYNWFTEGFDTQDLKDAKALLDELA
jgi:class 3 adenylate cyclase/predicted ATPase